MAALLAGFRNHLGYDAPDDTSILASVERIIVREDAEYLLAAAGDGTARTFVQLGASAGREFHEIHLDGTPRRSPTQPQLTLAGAPLGRADHLPAIAGQV